MNEKKEESKKHRRIGTDTRLFLAGTIVVGVVAIVSSIVVSGLQATTLEASQKILENVIQLDGVLFGFTATMLALLYYKEKKNHMKSITVLTFTVIAFLSYLASIFMSFIFLMQGLTNNRILVPVILACFGGLCSSVYLVMAILRLEETKVSSHE